MRVWHRMRRENNDLHAHNFDVQKSRSDSHILRNALSFLWREGRREMKRREHCSRHWALGGVPLLRTLPLLINTYLFSAYASGGKQIFWAKSVTVCGRAINNRKLVGRNKDLSNADVFCSHRRTSVLDKYFPVVQKQEKYQIWKIVYSS